MGWKCLDIQFTILLIVSNCLGHNSLWEVARLRVFVDDFLSSHMNPSAYRPGKPPHADSMISKHAGPWFHDGVMTWECFLHCSPQKQPVMLSFDFSIDDILKKVIEKTGGRLFQLPWRSSDATVQRHSAFEHCTELTLKGTRYLTNHC